MSVLSEIYQDIRVATYEAAAENRKFTIITFRPGSGGKIRMYRLLEKSGFWIVCGFSKG
jgi:hypothetical protein